MAQLPDRESGIVNLHVPITALKCSVVYKSFILGVFLSSANKSHLESGKQSKNQVAIRLLERDCVCSGRPASSESPSRGHSGRPLPE